MSVFQEMDGVVAKFYCEELEMGYLMIAKNRHELESICIELGICDELGIDDSMLMTTNVRLEKASKE